ncbi:MAG: hypothetical protein GY937_25595 [bacterium]|nr:hypothetical protein [bacterium]
MVRGLYGAAEELLSGGRNWREQVAPWLELSKAARTLVLPCAFLTAGNLAGWFERGTERWVGDMGGLFLGGAATLAAFLFLARLFAESGHKQEDDPAKSRRELAGVIAKYLAAMVCGSVLLFVGCFCGWFDFSDQRGWIASARFTALLGTGSLVLFLGLRVVHMTALYGLVSQTGATDVLLRGARGRERSFLVVGQKLLAKKELPEPIKPPLLCRAFPSLARGTSHSDKTGQSATGDR